MRRAVGLPTGEAGPDEAALLRAVGRLLHVDDDERIDAYARFIGSGGSARHDGLPTRDARLLRMLVASLTNLRPAVPIQQAIDASSGNTLKFAQNSSSSLSYLRGRGRASARASRIDDGFRCGSCPLHAERDSRRLRRQELARDRIPGRRVSGGISPSRSDLFAFTLDKSSGAFSPTTQVSRLRGQP